MHIKTVNGREIICDHIFPREQLQVGQHWLPADGTDREVVIVEVNDHYVWHEDVKDGQRCRRDAFGFQCRYCKIVD